MAVTFVRAGAGVRPGSDDCKLETIGAYEWCREVAAEAARHSSYSAPVYDAA